MVVIKKARNLFLLLILAACKVDIGTNESEQFKVQPLSTNVTFEQLKLYVLNPSCVRCHAWANDEAQVQQRIIVGNPDGSILYQKIKSGSMPPSGALPTNQLAIVENYIKSTKSTPTIALNSTFKSIQFHLINKSCLACHNDKGDEISFEGYANVSRQANKILNILDDGESADTPMPPFDEAGNRKAPLPTPEILEAFRTWINEGKLDN